MSCEVYNIILKNYTPQYFLYVLSSILHPNCTHTSITHFWKVCFRQLCFYKRPTLVFVFSNQKQPKKDFCLCINTHTHTHTHTQYVTVSLLYVISTYYGILQARILACSHSLFQGIEPRSLALQADSLLSEAPGKPQRCHRNTFF